MFDKTWEIKCILNYYTEYLRGVDDYDDEERDEIRNICAKAIELTCQDIGFVMPIDMFIDWTNYGSITPYDGSGYFLDENGQRIGPLTWSDKDEQVQDAVFVAWYNK
jgi:hypothetical protein